MHWTVATVRRALGDKLIGSLYIREFICKTVLLLPSEIIEKVCKTIWFISTPEDSWAFTFRGSELQDRSLIILSDELLRQNEAQIRYTLLHEI